MDQHSKLVAHSAVVLEIQPVVALAHTYAVLTNFINALRQTQFTINASGGGQKCLTHIFFGWCPRRAFSDGALRSFLFASCEDIPLGAFLGCFLLPLPGALLFPSPTAQLVWLPPFSVHFFIVVLLHDNSPSFFPACDRYWDGITCLEEFRQNAALQQRQEKRLLVLHSGGPLRCALMSQKVVQCESKNVGMDSIAMLKHDSAKCRLKLIV